MTTPFSNSVDYSPDLADKPVHSPISRDILDANNPPAEHDLLSIREFVSRGSARRAFLDTRIFSLHAELDKLLQERDSLDIEIRKHEGALSPLRRIPSEILPFIFDFASPFTKRFMIVEDGPWPLSAVCSRWRSIALSQPSLWTELWLDFAEKDRPKSVAGILLLVEAHLERSQKLPLTIKFGPLYRRMCTDTEQAVLDLLATHCDRWETVELAGSTFVYETLGSIRGRLPILRKLDIIIYPEFDQQELSIFDLFAACPALQEVFVNAGRDSGRTPVIVELPSAQLIRYSASNSWPNHVRVLTEAVNLVDCVLRLMDRLEPGSPIVLLPQLRRLSTSTAVVLEHLDTPALRELYCSEDDSTDLPAFLTRCPHLERLFLGWIANAVDVGVLLRAAPTVKNLFLYIPIHFASDLFSLLETPTLSADPERPATIPVLDTLSLCLVPISANDDPVDEDQLMRAVEGRWQHGSLRSLKLWAMRFAPSVATLGRMEALRAQGMQVVLHKRPNDLYTEMVPPDYQLYSSYYHSNSP